MRNEPSVGTASRTPTAPSASASRRERLREAADLLGSVAAERGSVATAEGARDIERRLAANGFDVVVFGEFKRGKTTFVNALLGRAVLPAGVLPLTSVVTAVTWGERAGVRIELADGRIDEVDPGDLERYVTERGNPSNVLGVVRATVSLPAEPLRGGATVIDTPGVGSVHAHNTDAARRLLDRCDAAIFVTSADPPISEAERAFLAEVGDRAATVAVVLNKIDRVSGPDRADAIAFTSGVVVETLGAGVGVHPMSAREALLAKMEGDAAALARSGFEAFEAHLRDELLREKANVILASADRRVRRLLDREATAIDVEARALELSAADREDARRRIEELFSAARVRRDDLRATLHARFAGVVSMLDDDLSVMRGEVARSVLDATLEHIAGTDDVRRSRGDMDAFMKESLRGSLLRWHRHEEHRIATAVADRAARAADALARIERDTVELTGRILHLDLAETTGEVELAGTSRFTVDFFEVPTILESILPDVRRLLPRSLVRSLLERDVREQVSRLVDKHAGRMRWDVLQRLDRVRGEIEIELDDRLEATIRSLSTALARADEDRARASGDAERARERLSAHRRRLVSVASMLDAVPVDVEPAW